MSKLMIILGIIVAAAGAVIGALIYVSPGQMQVLGLTPEVTAIMFVGGLGLIGLGGIIVALDRATRALLSGQAPSGTAATTVTEFTEVTDSPPPFPVPTPVVEPPPAVSKIDALIEESKAETSRAVAGSSETIAALDKAKDELKDALDVTEPEPPPVEEPPAEEPEAEDTQLFVVEERLIRGRPARVLSDGTVEAETDDGWMRFENLEHLEEYLDAMSPGQA
jgi:hypothetical protein